MRSPRINDAPVIASEAEQSRAASKDWIASEHTLLAMTTPFAMAPPLVDLSISTSLSFRRSIDCCCAAAHFVTEIAAAFDRNQFNSGIPILDYV